ncbi:MAG: proton-conducting transporter membrane subunit [Myxococcaceae bacterium]
MTAFELLLAPIGIAITALLLLASLKRSQQISLGISILSLIASYCLSHNSFEHMVLMSSAAILLFSSCKEGSSEEFKTLILLSTLGALTCVNSHDLMNLFIGIELLTLPIYGLIAWDVHSSKNIAAAIKYLVLAGASSAFMLLGMAFLYAESGSMLLELSSLKGAILLFVGIGFKLSLVPFHLWTGDIYEDSALPVTAFLATVSKIALVGALVHIAPTKPMIQVLSVIAILSMISGSLLTLRQQNMSRFLGYSSIAHMGYVLVGWLVGADISLYMTVYVTTLIVTFAILSWKPASKAGSIILILSLLSLMGMPVLPVFWGKYQILTAASMGHHWTLFGVFIFSSFISAYGYARLIAKIYLKESEA